MRHFNSFGFASAAVVNTSRLATSSLSSTWMSIFVTVASLMIGLVTTSANSLLLTGSDSAHAGSGNPKVKKVGDYRKDLKAFLKRSKSDDEMTRVGATIDMCLLHEQLVNDSRYDVNRQMQGFRAVASDRLKKCKKEIELRLLRFHRAKGKAEPKFDHGDATGGDREQRATTELGLQKEYRAILAEDMRAITSLSGGPINLWNYTGNPAGPLCDYGPDLVNLIENTINPEFWRRNGGNGIIEYYQPLRIIVVGASGRIQDEISGMLRDFRANDR